jgi:hypothetical protein
MYIHKLGDSVILHCSGEKLVVTLTKRAIQFFYLILAKDKHTDDDRSLIAWSKKDGILPFQRYSVDGNDFSDLFFIIKSS